MMCINLNLLYSDRFSHIYIYIYTKVWDCTFSGTVGVALSRRNCHVDHYKIDACFRI